MLKGKFSSWEEALGQSTGYDADSIIENTLAARLKVRDGAAVYERDTLLYDEIIYTWPLLSVLLKAAIENDKVLDVLDFGGSLGSSYYQNEAMLSGVDKLTWNIIEQPRIVEIGTEELESNQLRFYSTVDECLRANRTNVVLLSGALQCIEKPYELLDTLILINAEYFVLDRTPFLRQHEADVLSVQYTSAPYYKASYPVWFFNKKRIMGRFEGKYHQIGNYFAYGNDINNSAFSVEGVLFKRT